MGRNLNRIISELPKSRRDRIAERYEELKADIESLRELREISGKAQAEIAAALNIKQPSVSKIERQTDMYLSTLRAYVKALGGDLDVRVRLPKGATVRIRRLGDVFSEKRVSPPRAKRVRGAAPKQAAKRSRLRHIGKTG